MLEGAAKLLLLLLPLQLPAEEAAAEEDESAAATAAAAALDVFSLALDAGKPSPQQAAEALRAAGAREALQAVVVAASSTEKRLPPLLLERATELLSQLL